MVHMGSEDPFVELKNSHRDYKVFDSHYERIGRVDELFVDDADRPIYIGVSTGFLEAGSLLIPMDIVRINDKRGVVEIDANQARIEDGPSLGSGDDISPETEDKVRIYYGLEPLHSPIPDDARIESRTSDNPLAFDERIDIVPGEREAVRRDVEEDPPYRDRNEQILREERQRSSEREAIEREAIERDIEDSDIRGGSVEAPRETPGARIRRLGR